MGGTIRLHSKGIGQGTTVEVALPVLKLWSREELESEGKVENPEAKRISASLDEG
jgi:hypothetical protein